MEGRVASAVQTLNSTTGHMALVVSPVDHVSYVGVITLEDVVEELIQVRKHC